ncbi:M20/M25/M40 family metallo-hydrolase [Cytobacillus depressus]|uniref:M20/M25/M40 family metallo-hydrolase n=1 Tax=Cytobacillus depressus TaxID=1602942 RepID=A0A6L3VA57_9BACI|nr:M20/M25/M40 family metallo-hydrolase [Cytobacillus depressus]KAB2338042.1 M20/M25/M40 family metallo-hydrolase [Cytobacillus depressus]
MTIQKVYDLIDARREQYLETLFTLLRQKSISTQKIGIEECANLLKGMMEEAGIHTKIIETEGHSVVYGEIIKDPNAFTLLLYGHYDVQPPDPIDEWISPPFIPIIRDNKIFARGSSDNKGQLMAHVLAIKTYLDVYGELPINVKFVFEGEEEQGSINLESFVSDNRELLKADLVYTSDGPSHQSGAPLIILGVRGLLYVELKATGANIDNHSGNKGNVVPNPVWKLFELLRTMRDEKGEILIEGFYDNVREPSNYEKELIKKLPFNREEVGKQIGYPSLDLDGETFYRKLTMEPTFNIAGIQSGYNGEGMKTIIPSTATLKMDIRLVVDQTPEEIFGKLCNHVKKHAPDIEVTKLGMFHPSRTLADLELINIIKNALEEVSGREAIIQPSMGGSLPDYVWTKILKAPSIIVPYANYDQANHSPNENLDVDYFFNGIKYTCSVINRLADQVNKGRMVATNQVNK